MSDLQPTKMHIFARVWEIRKGALGLFLFYFRLVSRFTKKKKLNHFLEHIGQFFNSTATTFIMIVSLAARGIQNKK
ncbi:hypothetical protein BX661DRAFT_1244 [Kickxella alabastrina]|uniref:uncharacterized protein n=1 Tax=Kickxella alabastrina TaxID=61397 RepID=UPI002220CE14|nr:uncharacterized protein BX661DRAFT_1244 [Kickxella alabastrina]KAI7834511.1 hypothetical protein BX661DRAFT_1244 [Kickxella alabastrina]